MKKLLFIPLLMVSLNVLFGQKIKVSENDRFLKKYRIETSYVTLKGGMFNFCTLRFRSVDDVIFIKIEGNGMITGGVQSGANMLFLLENDSTITVNSKDLQFTTKGQYGESFIGFEYYIKLSDVKKLKDISVKSIRIYSLNSYHDFDIRESAIEDLKKLADVFLTEFEDKILSKNNPH